MNKYSISTGKSRMDTQWLGKTIEWSALCSRLAKVRRTQETVAQYKSMTKAQKAVAKDIGGFVGGVINGGRRKNENVRSRSLVTLDIDYALPDTIGIIQDFLAGTAWVLYSTHSHTPESPRYRLIVPLDREVTAEEYIPIARRVADTIGIDTFDDSTYQPERLMYWPSAPSDGEFVYRQGEGEPLSAQLTLDSYDNWRDVSEYPVSRRESRIMHVNAQGARQEDPTTKPGIIGAFCRSYGIEEAIETFLPGVYIPTATEGRYTFAGGSTACGAIIYDNKWLYSHHGTDPCCEKLCNAFDLVRIHKFRQMDDDTDTFNTPANKLPSFVAMSDLAREDKKVRIQLANMALSDLGNELGAEDFEDETWKAQLVMNKQGAIISSPQNIGIVLRNDPRVKDKVMRDQFRSRDCVMSDLPWRAKSADPYWTNSDDCGLVEFFSAMYGITGKTQIVDGMDLVCSQNGFHPVRNYLRALKWDGVKRLDALLIDYLGAADTPLTRAMTRKHLVAAVARVMEYKVKYDYLLTLIGPEGIGKSTLIRILGGPWFDDSLTTIEGKDAMEQLRGKWLVEIGELTNYKKSTSEAYKAFISKVEDSYRPAYGRKTECYPRQNVFFATTNERTFLKGDTGNRRFWTVECGLDMVSKNVWEELPKERDQIWAEALQAWKDGEQLYLSDELERAARALQESHNEVIGDDRSGVVREFITRTLPPAWAGMTAQQRQDFFKANREADQEGQTVFREYISCMEILIECFGEKPDERMRYRSKEIGQMLRNIPGIEPAGLRYCGPYGRQRCYHIDREKVLNSMRTEDVE